MKLFLGWSGNKSKETAEALSEWLPQVIQAVKPFFSPNMEKGTRWETEIIQELEESMIGIICLTKENFNNKWVLYEAGALSKMKDAYVCTFLLDLTPSQIERPLGMFQHTRFDKDDIWKLLLTINKKVKEANEISPDEKVLSGIFNKFWPDLKSRLEIIAQRQSEVTQPVRSDSEKLDEILELVRALTRRGRSEYSLTPSGQKLLKEWEQYQKYLPLDSVKRVQNVMKQLQTLIPPEYPSYPKYLPLDFIKEVQNVMKQLQTLIPPEYQEMKEENEEDKET
ncbi:MAG: hypothetical protein AYK19_15955 [Theionarchaea archaeon DG-70-1]|nr:MAG: hypothetical protein AYK19_15955 [Theionarchaea archaeon DG-70-1]